MLALAFNNNHTKHPNFRKSLENSMCARTRFFLWLFTCRPKNYHCSFDCCCRHHLRCCSMFNVQFVLVGVSFFSLSFCSLIFWITARTWINEWNNTIKRVHSMGGLLKANTKSIQNKASNTKWETKGHFFGPKTKKKTTHWKKLPNQRNGAEKKSIIYIRITSNNNLTSDLFSFSCLYTHQNLVWRDNYIHFHEVHLSQRKRAHRREKRQFDATKRKQDASWLFPSLIKLLYVNLIWCLRTLNCSIVYFPCVELRFCIYYPSLGLLVHLLVVLQIL